MCRPSVCTKTAIRAEICSGSFWRDVLSEGVATFVLVSMQCVLPLTWDRDSDFSQAVMTGLGMGFIVAAMAWSLGDFGGAHMNPAVTFAMVLSLKITVLRAVFYFLVQVAGALAGAGFAYAITPAQFRDNLAATQLGPGVSPWQGFLTETWITFVLVITIFGSTNSKRKGDNLHMPALVIGLTVSVCIFAAWNHTGASMNPARSFGPAVVKGIWRDHWVYWAGPLTGGAFAALICVATFDRVGRKTVGSVDLNQNNKYELQNRVLTMTAIVKAFHL